MDPITARTHIAHRTDRLLREAENHRLAHAGLETTGYGAEATGLGSLAAGLRVAVPSLVIIVLLLLALGATALSRPQAVAAAHRVQEITLIPGYFYLGLGNQTPPGIVVPLGSQASAAPRPGGSRDSGYPFGSGPKLVR